MRRSPVRRLLLALPLVVLWASGGVSARAQEAVFREGNALYQEGDFAGAAAKYETIVERGFESSALYYNLGNTRYRLGELAAAVVAYERAARLDPGNDDVRANLALVNQGLRDRIEPLPRFWLLSAFDWWMTLLPKRTMETAVAACWLLFGAAVVLLILRRPSGWRSGARRIAYGVALATVVLGGTLLLRETRFGQPEEAVVMAVEAQALSAPSAEGGLVVFTLHAGTKVRIDRRSNGWAEIVLADGKVGWLQLDALEVI